MDKTTAASFGLAEHGLIVSEIHHNLAPSVLYEHAIRFEKDATIAENEALVVYSGAKTGRSPKDKRVVENPASKNDVWWGTVNVRCDNRPFQIQKSCDRAKAGRTNLHTTPVQKNSRLSLTRILRRTPRVRALK